MVKEKTKINFHDKIMNPFEAELYVLGLRFGLIKPKLVGDEEHDYLKLKYLEEKRGEAARLLEKDAKKQLKGKELQKRGYLIRILESIIIDAKTLEKPEYCRKYGHIEEKGYAYTIRGIEGVITHYKCINCGTTYEKKLSETIHNPFSK